MRAAARLAALALLVAVASPSPAAPLSRSLLCSFDPGSAELTPRCHAVALEAAVHGRRMLRGEARGWPNDEPVPACTARVEVVGRADAADAAAGRASASRTRAGAVAASLRLNGVPPDLIRIEAMGAERLLVPARGAEPRNRRAEIIAR